MTASTPLVPDYSASILPAGDGWHRLHLLVEGIHCAACGFRIENLLQQEGVRARVNVTERRLNLEWNGPAMRFSELLSPVIREGYRLTAIEEDAAQKKEREEGRSLLMCLAVAGFASGNIMMLSWGLWTSDIQTMGMSTRDMFHWFSALIALPTVTFAGQPFFRSAITALKKGRTNMDVPISLAVILASSMSVVQTYNHAEHAYFDSAVMLLFFLLIGRYLDFRMRGRARSAARDVLMIMSGDARVIEQGVIRLVPARDLKPGMHMQVAAGEKILADGTVLEGTSEADTALLTGETLPRAVKSGDTVHVGMVNLLAPLTIQVMSERHNSWLAEVARLMETARQGHARFVRLADRLARYYTPVVHALALTTFLGWLFVGDAGWVKALLTAIAVLIITCPCALGLAVPIVQIIASNRLFRSGILLKSGDALEKLDAIDTVIFDKTGTLTLGQPELVNHSQIAPEILRDAAALASYSRHPLSQALATAGHAAIAPATITEHPGAGIEAVVNGERWQLGSARFCEAVSPPDGGMELWFRKGQGAAERFLFNDMPRSDAAAVCGELRRRGYHLAIYSGDRPVVARAIGDMLGIADAQGGMSPKMKHDAVCSLAAQGRKILYVGDGLNDAAALSAAHVSFSPSSGIGISQNAADMVFHGGLLAPVLKTINLAAQAQKLVRQNLILALVYNLLAVPLAIAGLVTPLIAALAMSSSSLVVILNSLRLQRIRI